MNIQNDPYGKLEAEIIGKPCEPRQGFWERRIHTDPTVSQRVYDVIFGIVAPILAFIFDPIVFQNPFNRINEGFLTRYKLLVYFISMIAITTLFLWFVGWIKNRTAFVSGILYSGALCSFTIGVCILPLSLFGLFVGIGILGFIPFLTALVYWRNAKRALNYPKHITYRESPALSVLLGMLLAVGLPLTVDYALSRWVSSSFQLLLSQDADAQSKAKAATTIKRFSWYLNKNRLMDDFEAEQDGDRKAALADAFQAITGSEIRSVISD